MKQRYWLVTIITFLVALSVYIIIASLVRSHNQDSEIMRMLALEQLAERQRPLLLEMPEPKPEPELESEPPQLPPQLPKLDKNAPAFATIGAGTKLTVRHDVYVGIHESATWFYSGDNKIVYSFMMPPHPELRLLPKGSVLTVKNTIGVATTLPGYRTSTGRECIIVASTQEGRYIHILVVAGRMLRITPLQDQGNLGYSGLGRQPTVSEVEFVFEIEPVPPGEIKTDRLYDDRL